MDNTGDVEALRRGLGALGIDVPEGVFGVLLRFRDDLLRWNQKVNLTAITDPAEALEKHLVDSLAVLPEVRGAASILDIGAGGGFPGIPLRIALGEVEVTLVDTVGKKVAFMKNAIAQLRLGGARALHARAEGNPSREGLPLADVVISRAFMDVGDWTALAVKYLKPRGRVVSMLGQLPATVTLETAAGTAGLRVASVREYTLPFSGARRAVAVFEALS